MYPVLPHLRIHLPAFFSGGQGEGVLFTLFIIFAAAKLSAEIFERLRQPAVVGEILAGVVIGPSVLHLVEPSDVTKALSEIGVILLLFMVGLETNPSALYKVGGRAFAVALSGVIVPFFAGWGLMRLWGAPTIEGIFLGAAMVATSVGITARVLAAIGMLNAKASQIILAAAVIDDILGLIVLSIVSSLAKGGINYVELGLTAGLSVGFTLFVMYVGTKIVKKASQTIQNLRVGQAYFVSAMVMCFGLSWLGQLAGVAAIIGAFLAGMALNEISEETGLRLQAGAVMEFSVPFFLVGVGLQLDLTSFRNGHVIALAFITLGVAILTKLIGCGMAAWSLGRRTALQVGMGMVPRGEVGIIVAQYGLSHGVLKSDLYGVVVFMAVATTLIAPPFLTRLFKPGEVSMVEAGTEEIVEGEQPFSEIG